VIESSGIQNILLIFGIFHLYLHWQKTICTMRIFTEQVLKEYAEKHPEAKVALQE
jgi:hypothetical protein